MPPRRPTGLARHLLRAHDPAVVRCAFILRWAAAERVDLDALPEASTAARFVAPALREAAAPALRSLEDVRPTLKDLEGAFEITLDAARRRAHGATYTPDDVIDHLVETALGWRSETSSAPPSVCDPACGSGGFLLRAARLLQRAYGVSPRAAFRDHLVGVDVDPDALAGARCLVGLSLLLQGEPVREGEWRLLELDALLTPTEALLARAGCPGGFDVLATNPPYVKIQTLDASYRDRLAAAYPDLVRGSFSLAPLFLVAGHRLLADGGHLAVITQNNLYTSLAGKPVRAHLQRTGALRRIVDFGSRQVFDNASAYTCLVFLGRAPQTTFEFGRADEARTVEALRAVRLSILETAALRPEKWRLAPPRHLENLRRIEQTGAPLGAVADIHVGFATLRDAVFLVRAAGDHAVPWRPRGDTPQHIELELTRSAVRVADLETDADLARNDLRVIFPYERQGGRYAPIPEPALRARFPGAYRYLVARRDELEGRDKGRASYAAWYAWGRTQGMEAPGPKLLTKTFSHGPSFFADPSDALFCNGYSVRLRAGARVAGAMDLALLRRVLESRVMHYYARLTSFRIQGDYECYQKNFIEPFGIPTLDRAAAARLDRLEGEAFEHALCGLYGVDPADVEEVLESPPQVRRRSPSS